MSLQSANTQEVGIFLWPGPFCNTFLLKFVPHSPPPSPPQPATKAWVNRSWVFLSHSTQLNSHAESAVQHMCQFWSAKPNPLYSAFLRLGLGHNCSSFCVACIISMVPTQLLLTPYSCFRLGTQNSIVVSLEFWKKLDFFCSKQFKDIFLYISQDLEFISNCYSQTKQCSFTPSTSFYRRNHLGMKIFNIKICNIFSLKKDSTSWNTLFYKKTFLFIHLI